MTWTHRAFISYETSDRDTYQFVHRILLPELRRCLRTDHGWPVSEPATLWVDIDPTSIPSGAPVPQSVRDALANACVIVPVLSAGYFQRPWCCFEIFNAIERHKAGGPAICPIWIADGDHFPAWATDLKRHDLRDGFKHRRLTKGLREVVWDIGRELHDRHERSAAANPPWCDFVDAPPPSIRHYARVKLGGP